VVPMLCEVQADIDRLKSQIEVANNSSGDVQDEMKSMAYEYICVAITGRLEQNVKTILITYANNCSERSMGKAISRLCQGFLNPSKDKLVDLVGLFDKGFADNLREEWQDDGSLGHTISDMVGKRKVIAHQTKNNRDVTRTKIRQYFNAYKDLVTLLDTHFLTRP